MFLIYYSHFIIFNLLAHIKQFYYLDLVFYLSNYFIRFFLLNFCMIRSAFHLKYLKTFLFFFPNLLIYSKTFIDSLRLYKYEPRNSCYFQSICFN